MAANHRCGKSVVLTLDSDIAELLPLIAPGKKVQGRYLSQLVRAEIVRNETRKETRQEIARELLNGAATLLP